MELKFKITNQHMELTEQPYAVSDSREYLTCSFEFSEDWSNTKRTVIFSGGNKHYCVLLQEDNTCTVPHEVLGGCFAVSVFGVNDGQRITTENVYVHIQKSGYCEATTPEAPTPTVYEQLLAELERIKGEQEIPDSSITAEKLADGAVTYQKLDEYTKGEISGAYSHADEAMERLQNYGDINLTPTDGGNFEYMPGGAEEYTDEGDIIEHPDKHEITMYLGTDTDVIIPYEYDGKPIIYISDLAFSPITIETSITSVVIPKSIKAIKDNAFCECENLTKIIFPESNIKIGHFAFSPCIALETVEIPGSATLGEAVFMGCSNLKSVLIHEGLTTLEEGTFDGCASLTDVVLPGTLTCIKQSAFRGCVNLKHIVIPDNVTSIGDEAFANTNLDYIKIPDSVTEMGTGVFKVLDMSSYPYQELPNTHLTIICNPGSYAETYAKENGLKYVYDAISPDSLTGLTARISAVEQDLTFEQRFWNSFYREGRTDYSYAFVNSGASEIIPPEPITANLISYALMNCVNLTDGSSIIFSITSDNPKCVSVCMGCLMLTRPPTVNFVGENAHVCRSYVSMFANCVKLTEAAIWLGDGTQSASGERVDMANTFLNCTELQSITFTGSGSPKNLDLSACKKLTVESIESLLGALQDVTGETAGTYEFKISSETSALMSEELKTAFTDKGWTVNVAEEAEA